MQIALSSFCSPSWRAWFLGWHACDIPYCPMQKPLHALQGVAPLASWSYRSRRPFLGDNMCTICRTCYPTLAIGCCWGSIGLYGVKYLLRCLCSRGCLSGKTHARFGFTSCSLYHQFCFLSWYESNVNGIISMVFENWLYL